jgi:MIP family channel proteins
MEAAALGLFMVSAGLFTTLFDSPASPVPAAIPSQFARRALTGLAMGLTLISIVYSPWGRQSGAHMNPALTLSFLRLGKVKPWDAFFYVVSQFLGGLIGVTLVSQFLRDSFRQPPVSWVATLPGKYGVWTAFIAEMVISFLMLSMVLAVSNTAQLMRYTGLFAGTLVFLYITFEGPISGMSMNPARSLASALPGRLLANLWIYFTAPLIGMLAAVELRLRFAPGRNNACAKYDHPSNYRCIHCGQGMAKLALLLIVVAGFSHAAIHPEALGPVALVVSDLDRSVDFYSSVLSFQKESERSVRSDAFDRLTGLFGTNVRIASMRLREEQIQLIQYVTPEGRPVPPDARSEDRWFQHIAIVVSDIDQAYATLRDHRVRQISTEPQTLPAWNPKAGGIRAFYFRDPDAHPLELIWFPKGKGSERWQSHERLFLGIDHSAIAVSDTPASLAFYRDIAGLRVAGESLNYGSEQEHLNHVFGSRVAITGLRAASGPGIEFLEYVTPRDGRPAPADSHPNDLWYWHTTFIVKDLPAAVEALRSHHVPFVSADIEDADPLAAPGSKGVLVRDPDGHAVLFRAE